jgi:hypothetical protein
MPEKADNEHKSKELETQQAKKAWVAPRFEILSAYKTSISFSLIGSDGGAWS